MKRFVLQGMLLLLGLTLPATDAFAQYGSARGKVVDEQGEGVANAHILIEYLGGVTRKNETKTNDKGEFIQVGLSPGQYRLTVSKDGYRGAIMESRINLGEATELPEIKILKAGSPAAMGVDPATQEFRDSYGKAIEQAQAGQHDAAIAAMRALIEKYPGRSELWEVHLNLGRVLAQKQEWAPAEEAIKKSLELKPADNSGAQLALADVYNRSGQSDKAAALLDEASHAGGSDPTVHLNLGITHLNAGRSAEAEAAFRKAIEVDPKTAEAHFHLGTILLGQGKTAESIASLEKYLELGAQVPQNEATAKGLLAALKK